MGMTVDEAIEYNKNLKMYMEINDEQDTYKFLEENHVALDIAIAIMGKYQKIQEVMDSRPDDDAKSNSKALGEIEVIMYGNKN